LNGAPEFVTLWLYAILSARKPQDQILQLDDVTNKLVS
jgi:hypothetical protein